MYILAVDDEQRALNVLLRELNKVFPSADVHTEQSPFAAIEWAKALKAEQKNLAYAFMDIKMPGMNGLEFAKQLKTVFPQVVLFFCTAYSEYAIDAYGLFAKGYLKKPVTASDIVKVLDEMVTDWRAQFADYPCGIRIQTFGHFSIFVDDKPVVFEREKAKELLAYLVDRHGASIKNEQIASVLWEDRPYDTKCRNIMTTIVSSLKKTLREYGIEDILIRSWGHLAVDISKFRCDAYDFEKQDAVAVNSFRGEYMSNYSWAEFTTGRYSMMNEKNKL